MDSSRIQRTIYPIRFPELLFIGRLAPEKNLPLLFKSLAILKKENYSFRLRVFGDGDSSYKSNLNELINQLDINGEVEFMGSARIGTYLFLHHHAFYYRQNLRVRRMW